MIVVILDIQNSVNQCIDLQKNCGLGVIVSYKKDKWTLHPKMRRYREFFMQLMSLALIFLFCLGICRCHARGTTHFLLKHIWFSIKIWKITKIGRCLPQMEDFHLRQGMLNMNTSHLPQRKLCILTGKVAFLSTRHVHYGKLKRN